MAFGIEIRGASGQLTLALTSRLLRYVGTATFSVSAGGYVDVSVPGCAPDGTWVAFCTSTDAAAAVFTNYIRVFSTSVLVDASGSLIIGRC